MNLDRFQRILKARWWFLAGVVVISVFAANQLTKFRNEQLPAREAVATITFTPFLGEIDDTGAQLRLENAESLALEINEPILAERLHLLAPWEVAAIIRDDRTNQLDFIGRGPTDAEAKSVADSLRDAFLDGDPFASVVDLSAQVATVTDRILELRESMSDATALPPTTLPAATDLTAIATIEALQAQIDALRSQYGALSVELLNPIFRSSAAIEAERAEVLAALVALQLQKQATCAGSTLPPCLTPTAVDDPGEFTPPTDEEQNFQLQIWQIETEQLEETYRALIQRSLESPATIADTEVRESTLMAADPVTNQALAAVAGLLVGIVGLLLADRVRKPIWAVGEVESRTALPEISRRGWNTRGEVWYLSSLPSTRKASVQTLRSVVEGLAVGGIGVGIAGLGVEPEGVQELSADLAAALAVSENKILLIDANFADPSELVEFGKGNQNLAKVLAYIEDGNMSAEEALSYLRPSADGVEGLRGLRAGRPMRDGPDLIARSAFGSLLEAAKSQFNVVIVSGASASSPITQVLSQRLDNLIVVGSAGHSLEADYASTLRALSDRRAEVVGLALLTGGRRRVRRAMGKLFGRKTSDGTDLQDRALPSGRHGNGRERQDGDTETSQKSPPPSVNGETPESTRTPGVHERSADPR